MGMDEGDTGRDGVGMMLRAAQGRLLNYKSL